jgi:hypothetical protein
VPDWFVNKDGVQYLVTPMLRFVKSKDKLLLQQAYMEIPKIKVQGNQKPNMVWMDVPCLKEKVSNENPRTHGKEV